MQWLRCTGCLSLLLQNSLWSQIEQPAVEDWWEHQLDWTSGAARSKSICTCHDSSCWTHPGLCSSGCPLRSTHRSCSAGCFDNQGWSQEEKTPEILHLVLKDIPRLNVRNERLVLCIVIYSKFKNNKHNSIILVLWFARFIQIYCELMQHELTGSGRSFHLMCIW